MLYLLFFCEELGHSLVNEHLRRGFPSPHEIEPPHLLLLGSSFVLVVPLLTCPEILASAPPLGLRSCCDLIYDILPRSRWLVLEAPSSCICSACDRTPRRPCTFCGNGRFPDPEFDWIYKVLLFFF